MRILLIEDDKILGESIKEYLESSGITVQWEHDDSNIDRYYNFEYFDLIILDLMLKYRSGEAILKMIKNSFNIPIIISTGKYEIDSKEECFLAGADDYLVKPYNPRELHLRINNILKKHSTDIIKIGDAEIDIKNSTVSKNGHQIKLTQKEWELLMLLIKNRHKIVNTTFILNYIWGDESVGTESIRTYIKRLRDIFGEESIETFKGRGYKLN